MSGKPIILLGSARKHSDTQKLVERLYKPGEYNLVDLLDYTIYQYNYEENYPADDDFLKIIEQVLAHDTIIFATPVYWYSMSAWLKIFFDRLTDLTGSQKAMGKALKGKKVGLIAVSTNKELPVGFEIPFRDTANYFHMEYVGCHFSPTSEL